MALHFLIHGQHRLALLDIANKLNLKVVNENSEVIQFSGTTQIDVIFANRPASQAMLGRLRNVGDRSREFKKSKNMLIDLTYAAK